LFIFGRYIEGVPSSQLSPKRSSFTVCGGRGLETDEASVWADANNLNLKNMELIMVYMITDHPANIVHFDYVNDEYFGIYYTNRVNDTVNAKHVTSSVLITDDNISDYEEIAILHEEVYWFATVTPVTMRDVPLDELLWHRFSAEHMMFGKKLYVYCVGDGEFEFACERILPDNQLVGVKGICTRSDMMEMFGMAIDGDDTYEVTEDMFEWARELFWYIDRGLEMVPNNRLKVVNWSLFYVYIATEFDYECFEFLFEGDE
tara:strand:- start:1614 stop:2393 length:780 start_codon:yes stop_codon:yes gene_type:complete